MDQGRRPRLVHGGRTHHSQHPLPPGHPTPLPSSCLTRSQASNDQREG